MTTKSTKPVSRTVLARRMFALLALATTFVLSFTVEVDSLVAPVFVATTSATLLIALLLFWKRDADPFEPLGFTAAYSIYGNLGILASLAQNGEAALPRLPASLLERESIALDAVLLNLVAFGTYAFGYRLGSVGGATSTESGSSTNEPLWSIPRMTLVSVVCGVVFIGAYAYFQSKLGLPLFSLSTLREGKAVWRHDPNSSLLIRSVQIGFLPLVLWGAHAFRERGRGAIVAVSLATVFVSLLVTRLGQRSLGIYPIIALIGMMHFLRRRVRWVEIIGAAFATIVFINASTLVRSEQGTTFERALERSSSSPLAAMSTHESERGRLDSTATILYFFPDRIDYLLGESWKGLLVLFVPRWIDPEKTRGLEWSDSRLLDTLIGFPAPTPLPAVLFANFGAAGVMLGMMAWGAFHGRLYRWFDPEARSKRRTLLYMLVLVFFNPTTAGFATALQYVVPGFLVLWFVSGRATSRVAPSRPPRPVVQRRVDASTPSESATLSESAPPTNPA